MTKKKRIQLYNSTFWKKKSKFQLKRQPLCEICLKKTPKKLKTAVDADHILPFKTAKEFINNPLQSLCGPCHTEKTCFDHEQRAIKEKTELRFF